MFNQQTEDTKKHGQAAALALLQFCLLFGAGGGEGAADCISQPEPSVRTWPWPSGGMPHCAGSRDNLENGKTVYKMRNYV